jgi:peptidoglycan/LPS O-acetylase OafA/YrhL
VLNVWVTKAHFQKLLTLIKIRKIFILSQIMLNIIEHSKFCIEHSLFFKFTYLCTKTLNHSPNPLMTKHLPQPKNRIVGLDLVRAVAILLVVIHHGFTLFEFQFFSLPDGVDVFFVLSGFLIGGILIKNLELKKQFSLSDLKHFWFRRWFRTLPAFWVVLFINYVITFWVNSQTLSLTDTVKQMVFRENLWEYTIFIQNLFSNISTNFFNESWSLSVEEWFYISLPICIFILLKSGISSHRAIFLSILSLILLPTMARVFLSDIHQEGSWMLTRMVVIMRLDAIGFGVLLAYLKNYKSVLWERMASSKILLVIGVFFAYLAFYIIHEGHLYFGSTILTNLFFYPLTSFSIMIALPALSRIDFRNALITKSITFISTISYSMYLVNYSIIIQLIKIFAPVNMTEIEKFGSYMIYWISTIYLSTLLYKYVEQPFMRLRDKYFVEF